MLRTTFYFWNHQFFKKMNETKRDVMNELIELCSSTREEHAHLLSKKQLEGYDYYRANIGAIISKYDGKWIGIRDDQILFPSTTIEDLLHSLDELHYGGVYIVQVNVTQKRVEI